MHGRNNIDIIEMKRRWAEYKCHVIGISNREMFTFAKLDTQGHCKECIAAKVWYLLLCWYKYQYEGTN